MPHVIMIIYNTCTAESPQKFQLALSKFSPFYLRVTSHNCLFQVAVAAAKILSRSETGIFYSGNAGVL